MLISRLIKFIRGFNHRYTSLILFIIIFTLSVIPVDPDNHVFTTLPKEGQNFKSPLKATVYIYLNGVKYYYENSDCYFSKKNPPYGTRYIDGGIQLIDHEIVNQIPTGGSVCSDSNNLLVPKNKELNPISFKILLESYSSIGHLIAYLFLSYSFMMWISFPKAGYTIIISLLIGLMIEITQETLILGRSASISDMVVNSIGIFSGIGMYYIWNRFYKLFDDGNKA